MRFKTYLAYGFKQLAWDTDATQKILCDKKSFGHAKTLIFGIASLVALLFFTASFSFYHLLSYPLEVLYTLLQSGGIFVFCIMIIFLWYGMMHIIATMLGGKSSIKQFIAVVTNYFFAVSIMWFVIGLIGQIPFIGLLAVLCWMTYTLITCIILVREVFKFNTTRATIAVLLGVAIVTAVLLLFGLI